MSGRPIQYFLLAFVFFMCNSSASGQQGIFYPPVPNAFGLNASLWDSNGDISFQFHDMDGDADKDILAIKIDNCIRTKLYYLQNTGNIYQPAYELDTIFVLDAGTGIADIELWDFDTDGDMDILITGDGSACTGSPPNLVNLYHSYFENTGSPSEPDFQYLGGLTVTCLFGICGGAVFADTAFVPEATSILGNGIIADLDDNGMMDILGTFVYPDDPNYSSLSFNAYVSDLVVVDSISTPLDGELYIVGMERNDSTVENVLHKGEIMSSGPNGWFYTTSIFDIDHDGLQDLISYSFDDDTLFVTTQQNLSTPDIAVFDDIRSYGKVYLHDLGWPHPNVSFEDVDADGDVDMFLVYDDGLVSFYENNSELSVMLKGLVFYDINQNDVVDSAEGRNNIVVELTDPQTYTLSSGYGAYILRADTGQYHISALAPEYWDIEPAFHDGHIAMLHDSAVGMNFELIPQNSHDLTVDIAGASAFWGVQRPYWVSYFNKGNYSEDAVINLHYDTGLGFVTSEPSPDSHIANTLSWIIDDLQPLTGGLIQLTFEVMETNEPGDTLHSLVTIEPSAQDVDTSDNAQQLDQEVLGSFDPNDKLVHPANETIPISNKDFTYTIRFQNTGHAPAINIIILDSLDADFEISSFQLIASSHMEKLKVDIDEHRVASFSFEQILLPDSSSNELESHGFVKYRIQANQGSDYGTEFTNTAHIFFDINDPVTTNTTSNVYAVINHDSDRIHDLNVSISPNPFSEHALFHFKNTSLETFTLEIMNANGQMVETKKTNGELFHLNCSNYQSGVYFFRIFSETISTSGKLVVEH